MSATEDVFGLLGTNLEGKYRVQSVIGAGGFGVVYRGVHQALKKPVAIKVLKVPTHLSGAAQQDVVKRFLAEAQIVAQLHHPAVVEALDFSVATMPAGQLAPWMALRWVDGIPLSQWMDDRRGQPCSPREILDLLRPVLRALALAHEQSIAHRDVKPPNIMVTAPSTARSSHDDLPTTQILDFGIAKAMTLEEEGAPTGVTKTASEFNAFSLYYAAPEQVSQTRTGPWTDVHALALIITQLLVGKHPYGNPSDRNGLMAAAFSFTRPTPHSMGVDVGVWEPVLARALAHNAGERYRSAGEFLAALEAAVPNEVRFVQAPPFHRTDPTVPPYSPSPETFAPPVSGISSGSTTGPVSRPAPAPAPRPKRLGWLVLVGVIALGLATAKLYAVATSSAPTSVSPGPSRRASPSRAVVAPSPLPAAAPSNPVVEARTAPSLPAERPTDTEPIATAPSAPTSEAPREVPAHDHHHEHREHTGHERPLRPRPSAQDINPI